MCLCHIIHTLSRLDTRITYTGQTAWKHLLWHQKSTSSETVLCVVLVGMHTEILTLIKHLTFSPLVFLFRIEKLAVQTEMCEMHTPF